MSKRPRRRPRRPTKKTTKKPFVPSKEPRARDGDVELVEGRGALKSGGAPGGRYWHVRYRDSRAGRAYINYHETESGDPRPGITVQLNARSRGRGIGTIAFSRACELSQYDKVYASVTKRNVASRKALERAGFKPVKDWEGSELYMVWSRRDS